MSVTQNEKIRQVTEETIVVGVDIASETHYARAFDWRGIELGKVFTFANSEAGFTSLLEWVGQLQANTQKTQVLVAAEPTGHYWFGLGAWLMDSGVKLVLVNPYHVKRSKELDDSHPSKSDRKDPKTIAKLAIEGRYQIPYIPQGVYAELRIAMLSRWRILKSLGQTKNQIARWLKIYFPEYGEVFAQFDGISSLLVLETAPLPSMLVELGPDGINAIWRKAKVRAVGLKRAKRLYEAAKASIGCTAGSASARAELGWLLEDYRAKMRQYDQIMAHVESLCEQVPGVPALLEITGVGLATVAGFLAEVGDVTRFDSPRQIQKLAGLAIRENSSGKHRGQTTISKRGRARLRAILFRAAIALAGKNREFQQIHRYYTGRAKNPLKKKQSIVALSCKLIRVFYALLTKGTAYDPEKLLGDIRRNTPLIAA